MISFSLAWGETLVLFVSFNRGSKPFMKPEIIMRHTFKCSIIVALIVFSAAGSSIAQLGLNVRLLGRFGMTMEEPSLLELDYVAAAENDPDYSLSQNMNTTNYGGGIQIVTKHRIIRLGIDIGVQRLFESKVNGVERDADKVPVQVVEFEWTDSDLAINAGAFLEFAPRSWMLFQIGLNVYQIYNRYLDVEEGETLHDITEWIPTAGFMVAAGLNIPISRRISIPILARADIIYRYGIIFPVHVNAGLGLKL